MSYCLLLEHNRSRNDISVAFGHKANKSLIGK